MRRDITPEQEAERSCGCATEGFDAFKWRVGAECGRDIDEWPGRTERSCRRWRARSVTMWRNSLMRTAAFLRGEPSKSGAGSSGSISHYEEPCPYWKPEETKVVTDALDLDVTGGEQDWDLATWERMIDMRAVDIVQPDVMYMAAYRGH